MGDVDGDGAVKVLDAMAALKVALNYTADYPVNADRNFDGEITLIDVIKIIKNITA